MYQLSVFVHLLSAVVWVGGMLFLALVVVPIVRPLPAAERAVLLGEVGRRFSRVGWVCIVLLVTTGTINAAYRGVTWENLLSGLIFASWFGQALAVKVTLVLVMIVLSLIHDFRIGPASLDALANPSPAAAATAARLRHQASWLGRLNALLALLVVALAVTLVRGLP